MRTGKYSYLLAGLVLLTACGGGVDVQAQTRQSAREEVREQLGETPAVIDTAQAAELSNAFRGAAQQALPAVVYVGVERQARLSQQSGQMQIPEQFRRFFGDVDPEMMPQPQEGNGSGFIIDERGHIMTNAHVVADASNVMVRLVDGREYDAEVVGADRNSDVAVLRITPGEGEELPVVTFGDSDGLRVGDWVLALGNPLGLDFSVTAGIVSAKGRGLPGGRLNPMQLESYIQTDAAINPGNSGGPLVDLLGRVVGVNTAIYGGGSRFVGYGFAVPVGIARKAAQDLLEYGYVRRPRIGVSVQTVNAVDAEVYRLPEVRGAEVSTVEEGAPASRAGIRVGDVIVAVDGEPIQDSPDLTANLARRQPGEEVALTLYRDGRRQDIEVTLGEFEQAETPEPRRAESDRPEETLGFSVAPLTPQLASQLGHGRNVDGPVVEAVMPGSPAAQSGVGPGLVILQINGESVSSVEDVQRIGRTIQPGDIISLRVLTRDLGETIINYRTRR